MPVTWIEESVILALHEEHLAEHGGATGIRGRGLLESALFRPHHLIDYDNPDIAALAAALCYGLTCDYPFFDGNKRTAFTVMELFLALNDQELVADDLSCVITMLKLAEGNLSENEFANWIRINTKIMR